MTGGPRAGAPPGKEKAGPPHQVDRPSTERIAATDDRHRVAPTGDNPTPYTRRHVVSCIHGRPRFCQPCVTRRRRVAFLLDELLADLYPAGWDR